MAENYLHIPLLNPVRFYDVDRSVLDKYFTRHFDEFKFSERGYKWELPADYCQIWQTDDIVRLQFESTFDPIIVSLLDINGSVITSLPALIGLPNRFIENTYSFEVELSLSGLETGGYYIQIEAGTGDEKKTLISGCMDVYDSVIDNSLCLEYWNSNAKGDVLFETGIKFQYRVHGHFGKLDPGRKDEQTKDQRYNPAILSSIPYRSWPVFFGDEYGLPDDHIDLLNRIWGCDNVLIDNKPFGVAEGGKMEFIETESDYRKRGVKLMVEEGVNRNSKVIQVNTDSTKKLAYGIMVDKKVFGDTSNQGSSNAVPVLKAF